jgi:hypothetical protein
LSALCWGNHCCNDWKTHSPVRYSIPVIDLVHQVHSIKYLAQFSNLQQTTVVPVSRYEPFSKWRTGPTAPLKVPTCNTLLTACLKVPPCGTSSNITTSKNMNIFAVAGHIGMTQLVVSMAAGLSRDQPISGARSEIPAVAVPVVPL